MDEEMVTTSEERTHMATRLIEDFEKEQSLSLDKLIAIGGFDRTVAIELIAAGMERLERYLITS